ncbi:MAG: helix-turn-helix transcriptional regulator [Clostridia bacterium]|nr:helix-turn-helix transcriptional regulator [Clostridia bacterium]
MPITLKGLSERFFISVNTLCKRFHENMNCSVMEYTTFVRLNKAKMYLLSTKKGVEEIAGLCGFLSANYFGLIFKKQFGCSPTNYRKLR